MNTKLSVVLALSAGLAGGLLTRYIAPTPVFAQNQAPVAKEIRAQSFSLVDPSNRVVGTFSFVPPGRIVLWDANGREIWSAGGRGLQPITAK